MNTIVQDFERHLFEDGKSIKTIESYIGDVTGLMKYLESMGVEFDGILKRFYITSYKNNLIENGYEPTTINKKINSYMSLSNYLLERGYMNEVVIDLRKDRVKIASGSEHQVEVFSDRLVERILFYIQNQKKVRLRDRMIIQILMFTGVRVSELCDIKIKNIEFLTGHLKVVGKGGKIREVPLKPEIVVSIREYLVKIPIREGSFCVT